MRILMITPELPYPLDQGGRIRMFHILRFLAERHELHLVSVDATDVPDEYLEKLNFYCASIHVIQHSITRIRTVLKIGKSIIQRKPYILSKHYSQDFNGAVSACIVHVNPDCILLEYQYLLDCLNGVDIPIVVDLHNNLYIMYSRFANSASWHPKKVHGYFQRNLIKKSESELPHRVSHCTTVSDDDRKQFEILSGADNLSTVPNGVDINFFQKQGNLTQIKYDLLFVGSIDYYPNEDAVIYLLEEIMPLVWQHHSQITVAIVGRNPSTRIRQFERDERVFVSGFVDDVRPYYEHSKIVVIPIRMGSGTRLKVLEAAAMSKAIVGTKIGLEGLQFENDKVMVAVETTQEFVAKLNLLLGDGLKRKDLETNSRSWVEENYSWEAILPTLERVLVQSTQPFGKA